MNQNALVSVIMPAYNAERFIEASIKSVQEQTYSHWELLVIDDASADNTSVIIQEFAIADQRIKLIQNKENQGPGISRNKGISAANGKYIAFLDADDLWKPHKLSTQLDFMCENEVSVCFSSYEHITENGKKRREVVQALPYVTYQKLLKSNYIGNLTGIYNAAELGKIYGPEIRKRQDWGLWLAAVKRAETAKSIKEPLAIYRLRRNSVSGNKFEMLRYNFNIYNKVLGFGFFKSLRCMLMFLKEHFFVKRKQLKTT
ncbi:glycosyltransferase family 2 protein [Salegentibacter sediminis]|uniref:glycosyltransferase family 2 protein n=1 Tax=Salegentibacter sediminis TaxID=1930251 RepID=UPI0009BF515A|nr:glycosyltransferase family 2 protein [Salegentibacter sediminis]